MDAASLDWVFVGGVLPSSSETVGIAVGVAAEAQPEMKNAAIKIKYVFFILAL